MYKDGYMVFLPHLVLNIIDIHDLKFLYYNQKEIFNTSCLSILNVFIYTQFSDCPNIAELNNCHLFSGREHIRNKVIVLKNLKSIYIYTHIYR